jgi:hypothetical protein
VDDENWGIQRTYEEFGYPSREEAEAHMKPELGDILIVEKNGIIWKAA